MTSLSAHLRRPGDHGRLAFHPQCPVCCRERLAGTLSAEALVSRRAQALLAAGVLALSTTAPTAVLAAEPDQEQEGSAAPEPVGNADPGNDPDFDPGGDSNDLPFDAGPAPPAQSAPDPDDDDTGALEPELTTNDDAPIADAGEDTRIADAGERPAPAATAPVITPPASAPPAAQAPSEPSPAPPASETPNATPDPPDTDARTRAGKRRTTRVSRPQRLATTPSSTSAPTTVLARAQPASPPAAARHGRAARRGDRFHVVLRGESLWSIARDLVDDGASAARIAREVNRLWELNIDGIGTGDRDLLMVGTRLALR